MPLAVWLAGAAFILYVIALYPAALALAARRRQASEYPPVDPLPVSVILAVYNGAKWIERKMDSILALDYPRDLLEILVVSDGCIDGTDEIVERYADRGIELLRVPHGGKAAALGAAIGRARGEILFFTDVRQRLATDALRRLVACFGDPRIGVASGELIIGDDTGPNGPGLYWRYEKWIRVSLSRIGMLQGATGCIYAMRRKLARPMPPGTLLDDVYLPLGAFLDGAACVFEPRARAYDIEVDLSTEFGRKVRTLAGVYQVVGAYPRVLLPWTRGWLHFASHKLGRLLLPYALIACLIAPIWMAWPWNLALIAPQFAVYGMAFLDPAIPAASPLKRLTAAASTFAVLMLASLLALPAVFLPRHRLWGQRSGEKTSANKAS